MAPTDAVALIPVRLTSCVEVTSSEPILVVALTPVTGTPISTIGVPTEEVADTPVNGTPISIINDPTLDVAETPVRLKSPGPYNNPGVPIDVVAD